MLVRGLQYLRPELLFSHPQAELDQSKAGGFLDPLIGTFLLTVIGTADRGRRSGVATAVWLTEYGRPFWLARAVESGGRGRRRHAEHRARDLRPDRVLQRALRLPLVHRRGRRRLRPLVLRRRRDDVADRAAAGRRRARARRCRRSRATCARPPTRSARRKAATIRRVLLPGRAPGHRDRHDARHGPDRRRHRDRRDPARRLAAAHRAQGGLEPLDTLRGTGITLTSYVYNNSPAGEGNAPEKAYAAAFVLLLIVVAAELRRRPDRRAEGGARVEPLTPPPIRRIVVDARADDRRAAARRRADGTRRPQTGASRSARCSAPRRRFQRAERDQASSACAPRR